MRIFQIQFQRNAIGADASAGKLWQGGKAEPIYAQSSQETLVETTDMTRSRVSHFESKFRKVVPDPVRVLTAKSKPISD
jgi:hypothetical protein